MRLLEQPGRQWHSGRFRAFRFLQEQSHSTVDMMGQATGPSGVVLVAEDDAVVRSVAVEILRDAGYQVLEVANADDAINVLKMRTHVKLVFSDVDMPGGMDGINLLHFVHDHWPDIRLLLTSGRFRPGVRSLPEACQFLGKPYTSEQLLRGVRRSLSQE